MHRTGLALAFALVASACAATQHRFAFEPTPYEVGLIPVDRSPVGRTLVTVLEGRRTKGESEAPLELHLRIRLENVSGAPIGIEPTSLLLVGSDLEPFGAPRIDPELGEVPDGESRTWDLWFGYPEGVPLDAPELDGLNLKFRVRYEGGTADVPVTFDRVRFASQPRVGFGLGFGYTHVH
jgi:hypothetical protein